jgi:hypothetical protein
MQELPSTAIKPFPKSGVREELIGQELFLYDQDNNQAVHCLNSGAALIWLLCDGTRGVESIAEEIVTASSLPKQEILADVQKTVDQFQTLGLLKM